MKDLHTTETNITGGPLRYLWHYNYDGEAANVQCDEDYVDGHCLKYTKKWPINKVLHHRITWYLKPRSWNAMKDDVSWEDFIKGQGSAGYMAFMKTICFGPLMTNIDEGGAEFIEIRTKIKNSAYYHFSFSGKRSECPSSAKQHARNTCLPHQQDIIPYVVKNLSLALLKMGKSLPETC
jgi:hypothetical protein